MSQKLHFIGIGGSGISGVARLAELYGFDISGCDKENGSAYASNLQKGHSEEHLKGVDVAITSPALFYLEKDNPEIAKARELGILITWQKFVADYLCSGKSVICIAGTHGKSTTTAMVGKILSDVGMDPTVVIGANVPEWGGNYRYGNGKYVVIEADEFNDNFLNYSPDYIVINNIEFDHPDFFKDFEDVKKSFELFTGKLKGEKVLITQKDSLHKVFNLKLYGKHNQENANMAFLICKKLGIDESKIIKSLEEFGGIGRRMELVGESTGIRVYDDYAHHPTAVKSTLEGLRNVSEGKRIIAVLEPHGYARSKKLLDEYKGVFGGADKVYVGPIYAARDSVDPEVSPQLIAVKSGHFDAGGYNSFSEILENIGKNMREGDIYLVMGAGKSYLWAKQIAEMLPAAFKNLTTIKTGGLIKKYVIIKDKNDIPAKVKEIKKLNIPMFILGGGSDILVSDKNFDGAVLHYRESGIKENGEFLEVAAGTVWDDVCHFAVNNNLAGIECLSGIPGSSGAAPIQNIGAYGQEIKDIFFNMTAYDLDREKFVEFGFEDCGFDYRESIFKSPRYWQKYLIVSIKLKLVKNGKPKVAYESLKKYFEENNIKNPDLAATREAVLKIRKGKFEDPKVVGNAGSFFKNPVIGEELFGKVIKRTPDLNYFKTENGYKIFAGWLIEKAGWKGKIYKSAAVSPNHALILINPTGRAKAQDIYELSEKIIKDIFEKYGVILEREVQLINF
jgi:UDP-N-acetylmuramate--alanine ligase